MNEPAAWRAATPDDLDAIVSIQDRVHTLASESREVFAAKLHVFPQGCRVLAAGDGPIGYGVFHPWRLGHAPALHALPFSLPDPADCLFVHDVAVLPEARGRGAVRALIHAVHDTARMLRFDHLALVSVYDTAPFWRHLGFVDHAPLLDDEKRAQYGSAARYMVARAADANDRVFDSSIPRRRASEAGR